MFGKRVALEGIEFDVELLDESQLVVSRVHAEELLSSSSGS